MFPGSLASLVTPPSGFDRARPGCPLGRGERGGRRTLSPRRRAFLPGLLALSLALSAAAASAQQAGEDKQPGTHWSEAQLKQAVAAVRVGRRLTPKAWPGGAKVAVCLTFDCDYEASLLLRGETAPVALSEREYGAKAGLPRILRLLDEHHLPATFFFTAVNVMLHPEEFAPILKRGRHEVGVHGWIHEDVLQLGSEAEERRLLGQAVAYLTKACGKRPAGYRSPSWAFSPWTMKLVREFGFVYDSSMMGLDEPYELMAEGRPTGVIELPPSWILDDAPYLGRTGSMPAPELVYKAFRDEFDVAYREGTLLMLTCHPYVSGHRSPMVELEKLVTYMQSKPEVWFATCSAVAEFVKTRP